ncbi:N-acetylneuraminate synthase family protein [Candidatus Pelagibacter bacterium nBUS_27]|uniref:N-acetylneuraminate synthase family protein n=1 Tax=Candidatus Pelagibacter bacterium nBUS_27 TaxID=3374188 RepID=UPI003EC0E178
MTKVICELGINHFGSKKKCKELIDNAKQANAWGIKFQYRNLKSYFELIKRNGEIGKEIIDTEIKKNYLSPEEIRYLSNYGRKLGLEVGISFFNEKDTDDFKSFVFDFYKIPSVSALDFDLIKKLNTYKKKIFISLGSRSHSEILKNKNKLINYLNKDKATLFHCVSNYPLNPINSNLNYILKLKKIFKGFDVGYSSHENDIFNCIIALSKNIKYIERHITHNKNYNGLDHSSSSDLSELKKLCFYSSNYNKISNSKNNRNLNQGEKINLQNLGKSAYANKDIDINKKIKLEDITFLSPKISLEKNDLLKFLYIKNKKILKRGDEVTLENFFPKKKFKDANKVFCNKKNISIPIRPSDYKLINEIFNIKNYEFHLSFNDVLSFSTNKINKKFLSDKKFSVHGPDYCDSNNILDIFSKNKLIKQKSKLIFKKCINICRLLKKYSGNEVYLIQSFSSDDKALNLDKRYNEIKKVIDHYLKKDKVQILPQWLPPIAWYFGGSSTMKLFCDPTDLKIIKKNNIKLCLDLSHFILSCNYYQSNLDVNFDKYEHLFFHYHIADASGIDGEGLEIGKGDLLKYKKRLRKIIANKKIKVLESWQGHLNNGLIFKKEISKLIKIT